MNVETLNVRINYVPDLIQVTVVAPLGNSDHSSLSTAILMVQAANNLCVSRKVFLKHRVIWTVVYDAIQSVMQYNL